MRRLGREKSWLQLELVVEGFEELALVIGNTPIAGDQVFEEGIDFAALLPGGESFRERGGVCADQIDLFGGGTHPVDGLVELPPAVVGGCATHGGEQPLDAGVFELSQTLIEVGGQDEEIQQRQTLRRVEV